MVHCTENDLDHILQGIKGADISAKAAAARYADSLAAPPGSLGKLTDTAIRLAGITGRIKNRADRRRIIVLCADNGVVEEGISSTPQSVTLSQAINMTRHLTGMSSLAGYFGDEVEVVDVGIRSPYIGAAELAGMNGDLPVFCCENQADGGKIPVCDRIVQRRIRRGTRNLLKEAAMTRQETLDAIGVGIERAQQAASDGIRLIGVGEMGIGNTTTSSAVLAALTGLSVEEVTGRGGGLTDEAFLKKKKVITDALRMHGLLQVKSREDETALSADSRTEPHAGSFGEKAFATPSPDPVDVLAKVGGLDIAAMCGVFLGAAACRIPVVIDGFISIVAALCAARLCPAARDFMFPSHVSEEVGYMRAAQEMGLSPWLHLNMRLGEGSGCPLAFQIIEASCALMNEMATFEEAAIDDSYLDAIRK